MNHFQTKRPRDGIPKPSPNIDQNGYSTDIESRLGKQLDLFLKNRWTGSSRHIISFFKTMTAKLGQRNLIEGLA